MKRMLAAACAAATLGLAPLPAGAQPSGDGAIEIEITDIAPVHTPGETLPVSLRISNEGARQQDVAIDLTAQRSVPLYRSTVTRWISDEASSGEMLTLDERTVDIPRGETIIDIEVPAEVLTWGNTSQTWGPRGVQARASTSDSSAADRTVLITEPSYSHEPMTFTTMVPLTVSHDEISQVPTSLGRYEQSMTALQAGEIGDDEELPDPIDAAVQSAAERVIRDIGRLTSPGITLMLDSSFAALEYGTVELSADALEDFVGDDGRELGLLPALDADLSAWSHTGADRFFLNHVEQVERSQNALGQRDIEARSDILFVPGPMTADIAALGWENGAELLVVDHADMPPTAPLDWTPSAHALLAGGANAVIADEELSRLLAGESDSLSDLDRRQTLLALTAIHYRERPNDHRPLVLTVPRGDDLDSTMIELNELVGALDETSWLEGGTVSDIEELPLDPFDREPLGSAQSIDREITPRMLDSMREAGRAIATIGDLTTHSHLFRDAVEATYGIAGSWSLTVDEDDLLERIDALQELADSLFSRLTVQSSSTINLISQASEFPVHISSTLPVPITVAVDVHSEDRRLQFEPVTTVLQPNTTSTVGVPVTAIGSGNVSTQVDVVSPSGQIIGAGTEINIRVRADWENVGTAIIAGLFLIILIVGVVRSARRGTRTSPIAEADTLGSED